MAGPDRPTWSRRSHEQRRTSAISGDGAWHARCNLPPLHGLRPGSTDLHAPTLRRPGAARARRGAARGRGPRGGERAAADRRALRPVRRNRRPGARAQRFRVPPRGARARRAVAGARHGCAPRRVPRRRGCAGGAPPRRWRTPPRRLERVHPGARRAVRVRAPLADAAPPRPPRRLARRVAAGRERSAIAPASPAPSMPREPSRRLAGSPTRRCASHSAGPVHAGCTSGRVSARAR